MNCDWIDTETPDESGQRLVHCTRCGRSAGRTASPHAEIFARCKAVPETDPVEKLHARERLALFGASDPTLIGNRVKELLAALGIPPCGGCEMRVAWLNRAHSWLRHHS